MPLLAKAATFLYDSCPKHLFPMETVFRRCFLINFAMKPETLQALLPYPIKPTIYERTGEAFLSVVIADMDKMRPAFLPRLLGTTYSQVVYRAVTSVPNHENGVHFLRSDADSRYMCVAGNFGSFFRFHHANVNYDYQPVDKYFAHRDGHITRHASKVSITVQPTTSHPPPAAITFSANLTSGSPTTINPSSSFEDLPTAKQFLTHLFAAYAIHPRTKNLTKVSITRSEWKLEALHEFEGRFEFMQNVEAPFKGDVRLDSAFHVEDLYYYWYTLEQFPAEGGESVKGRVKGGVLEDDSERRRSPI